MSEIKLDPRNYRKHGEKNKQLIKDSLKDLGAGRSIVLDNENVVVAGNGVYEQAKQLGLKVRIIETDGTELVAIKRTDLQTEDEKRKLLAIADNKTADTSEFDFELLSNDFEFDFLNDIGFEDSDFDFLFEDESKDAIDDDYDIPSEIETTIKGGDIIEIGNHRLICGDSTKKETFTKLLKGKIADMVNTDPPYNVDYNGKTKDALKIENDNLSNNDFYKFLLSAFTAMAGYVKQGGAWYIWHADTEGANFRNAMVESGVMLKQCLIWVKNSMVLGRQDYHWQHEPCLYGWKPGAKHNWYSDRKQTTVLEFNKPKRNEDHPTMKPIPLIAYQISNSSKKGQIVLDGFGGSGSTMVAAQQLERVCYMVETDPKYCQVIIDRMMKAYPELDVLINGKIILMK